MREVVPDALWIGSASDVRDGRRLMQQGVAAVVDLALEETAAQLPHEMVYCRFPLVDGGENPPARLAGAVHIVAMFLRQHVPVLVACGAGMSRAPAVVAIAIALVEGRSPDESLTRLATHAPHDVSTTLWQDLLAVYNEVRARG
jgi:protein-tyrosine phosphatase